MALTTSNYEIPYPELTDSANVPSDMEQMAEKLDTILKDMSDSQLTYTVLEEWDD